MSSNQSPQPDQKFWVYSEFLSFSVCIADFWQTFWVIWENGSNWSNLRLKMSVSALGRLKNHNVPHLHPNFTMFMPLNRLQLKMYAIFVTFHAFSKHPLLMWIRIGANLRHKLYTFAQINWTLLRFYSVCLSKNFKFAHWGFWLVVQNYTFEIKQQWGLVVQ